MLFSPRDTFASQSARATQAAGVVVPLTKRARDSFLIALIISAACLPPRSGVSQFSASTRCRLFKSKRGAPSFFAFSSRAEK